VITTAARHTTDPLGTNWLSPHHDTVVSWSRCTTRARLIDRSKAAIATPTETTTSPNTPTRISVPALLVEPLPEKNRDSRVIAPNSAIEAEASTN